MKTHLFSVSYNRRIVKLSEQSSAEDCWRIDAYYQINSTLNYVVIGWKFDIDIKTINSCYGHLVVFVLFPSRLGANTVNISIYA